MRDEEWMELALTEAWKGVGRTAPNPPVGAVVVKDGKVLGRGWHRRAGGNHAEVEALSAAIAENGPDAPKGSTIYITLEPCSTTGRTPPCTTALIHAGISRVVYASEDPNPAHSGAARTILTNAGIEVIGKVLADRGSRILKPFSKVQRTGLPWVIWKCAMSLDGKITRPEGEGQWLSGEESRRDVQTLRSQVDAILTSGETVRRDLPALTIRVPELLEGRSQPWRVVATRHPETMPPEAALFTDEWKDRTLVRSQEDIEETLRRLVTDHGVLSVMLEAGGRFSAEVFRAGLVDEVVIYYAPVLCGGAVPALAGDMFPRSLELEEIETSRLGNDTRLRGLLVKRLT